MQSEVSAASDKLRALKAEEAILLGKLSEAKFQVSVFDVFWRYFVEFSCACVGLPLTLCLSNRPIR